MTMTKSTATLPLHPPYLRAILKDCAVRAHQNEPNDVDCRARNFIAMLSGSVEFHDTDLSDALFSILQRQQLPAPTPAAESIRSDQ